jgi:hypothetical protein
VGSQSILGSVAHPPLECLVSTEADIYPKDAEELSDKIEGALGEGSPFHDTYGYYAQGVDSKTAVLALGWESRLIRLQTTGTNGRVAYCIDVLDLFLSKCAANREKDRSFNTVLLRAGLVDAYRALQHVADIPVNDGDKSRICALIKRLAAQAIAAGPLDQ